MKSKIKAEVSQESLALAKTLQFQAVLKELINTVFFLVMGLLLIRRLDWYVVLWFIVNKVCSSFVRKQETKRILHYNKLKTGQELPSIRDRKKLKVLGWFGEYVLGHILQILVLLWLFSMLSDPLSKAKGAAWLLIFSIISLVIQFIVYLVNRKATHFLKGIFLPLNVILWRMFSLSRPELMLLFWVEGFLFLIFAVYKIWKYDPDTDSDALSGALGKFSKFSALKDIKDVAQISSLGGLSELSELATLSDAEKLVKLEKLRDQGLITNLVITREGSLTNVSFSTNSDSGKGQSFSFNITNTTGSVVVPDDDDENPGDDEED